jgi:hypothetical protein
VSQDPWQNPNNQQQGPPAAPPAYPAYPGGAYGAPAPVKPPMPGSVRMAVNFMFAGMAIGLVHIVIGMTEINKITDKLRDDGIIQTTIDSDKRLFMTTVLIGGLIGAGLWLWMALACRAGQNYARIVSSVFFGIGVLGSLSSFSNDWVPALDKVFSALTLIVGLLSIIFVWNKQSGPYFRRPTGYEYGYPQQQPPYGQPPYGQG